MHACIHCIDNCLANNMFCGLDSPSLMAGLAHRAIWNPAFNIASLAAYHGVMLDKAEELAGVIHRLVDQGQGFDIWALMVRFSLDLYSP